MKIFVTFLLLVFSASIFSLKTIAATSCTLEVMPEAGDNMGTVDGTLALEKVGNTFTMLVKGTWSMPDEDEPSVLDFSDVCEDPKEFTGDALVEEVKNDDLLQYLESRLGEKAINLRVYVGRGFKDDGAGLALFSMTGESGKSLSATNIGWLTTLCK